MNHTERKGERWKVRMQSSDSGKQTTQNSPPRGHPHKPHGIKSKGGGWGEGGKAEALTFPATSGCSLLTLQGKKGDGRDDQRESKREVRGQRELQQARACVYKFLVNTQVIPTC